MTWSTILTDLRTWLHAVLVSMAAAPFFWLAPNLLIFEMSQLMDLQVMNTSHLVSCKKWSIINQINVQTCQSAAARAAPLGSVSSHWRNYLPGEKIVDKFHSSLQQVSILCLLLVSIWILGVKMVSLADDEDKFHCVSSCTFVKEKSKLRQMFCIICFLKSCLVLCLLSLCFFFFFLAYFNGRNNWSAYRLLAVTWQKKNKLPNNVNFYFEEHLISLSSSLLPATFFSSISWIVPSTYCCPTIHKMMIQCLCRSPEAFFYLQTLKDLCWEA